MAGVFVKQPGAKTVGLQDILIFRFGIFIENDFHSFYFHYTFNCMFSLFMFEILSDNYIIRGLWQKYYPGQSPQTVQGGVINKNVLHKILLQISRSNSDNKIIRGCVTLFLSTL